MHLLHLYFYHLPMYLILSKIFQMCGTGLRCGDCKRLQHFIHIMLKLFREPCCTEIFVIDVSPLFS